MPDLDEPQKRAVIIRLARFATAREVAAEIKQAYGKELSPQQINAYNPATLAGERLSEEHKDLFAKTRAEALADEDAIPGAKRSYRLLRLMQIAETAPSDLIQMKALEQMAKEMGGLFVRAQEKSSETGPDGKPVEVSATARETAGKELDAWRKQQAEGLPALLAEPPP